MDRDGFYHGASCANCGRELRGQGSGYPAESYAGTFNGLCYPCTNRPPFELTEKTFLSGARLWNHPPPLPSHRRDRVTYYAFADCPRCRGTGGQPGKEWRDSEQCSLCKDRHYGHPAMVAFFDRQRRTSARYSLVNRVANRMVGDIQEVIERSRGCWTLPGPIRWPEGWKPTAAEIRATKKLFPGVDEL